MTSAMLPAPPSVNNLFKNVGKLRKPTAEYKAWREAAGYALNRSGLKPVDGPVYVLIRIGKCNRARDCDNFCKAPLDLLVTHKIIASDNLTTVYSVTAEHAFENVPEGMIEVFVSPAIVRGAEFIGRAA